MMFSISSKLKSLLRRIDAAMDAARGLIQPWNYSTLACPLCSIFSTRLRTNAITAMTEETTPSALPAVVKSDCRSTTVVMRARESMEKWIDTTRGGPGLFV